MTVAELLAQSREAHLAGKRAQRARDRETMRGHWATARQLRVEAFDLDPERTDPAWASEQALTPDGADTHAALLDFYDAQV